MEKILRISAKALVVHEAKLLVIRKRDDAGDYYIVPGGGQEHGETLMEVIRREVWEETGLMVEAEDIAFIREYIGANHEFAETSAHFHQVELYFRAHLAAEVNMCDAKPSNPDSGQTGIEWIPFELIETARIYPKSLRHQIARRASEKIYCGDVN